MTCSSVSTNRLAAACALIALLGAGCGTKSPIWPGKVRTGSVDVARLAVKDPAWSNVVFYDRMLAALPAPSTPTGTAWTTPKPAVLPSIATMGETHTDLALDQERTRLDQVRRREVAELTQRLAEAREYRLRVEGFGWRRDQQTKTNAEIERINADYAQRVADETKTADTRQINLQMQVASLQKLIDVWALSKPGIPELAAAREQLAQKQSELETAQTAQKTAFALLRANYRQQLADAVKQGVDAVAAIRTEREAEYKQADTQEIALAQSRFEGGMASVLNEVASAENRSWIQASAPPPVNVGYQWPQLPVDILTANQDQERQRLTAERQRWVDYAYDDTKLAAADVAAGRHWRLSFLMPGAAQKPAVHDLTGQVASALESGRWKASR